MKTTLLLPAMAFAAILPAHAATLVVGFQQTIGSEQHPDATSEGGPFNVSVNSTNPGYAAINYRLPNTNTDGTDYERDFSDPVQSYSFVGGGTRDVLTVSRSGGDNLITYTTTDTVFDGFAQSQLQLWTTNDPGSNLTAPTSAANSSGSGYRSFGQIAASIDISGLTSGTVNIFYGAFSSKPTVSVLMKDLGGVAPDLTISNAHLNGDTANRAEYYAAEVDFVTDGVYDVIEYTWLSNGTDDTGNGRFGGTVLTGVPVPEPSAALLGGLGLLTLLRSRR